jgi:hypothetical protein
MRPAAAILLLGLLSGCVSGPREYTYDIDLKNVSDRPISLELLQARTSNIGKVHADLAPGGVYSNRYTMYGEAEYLEARLRFPAAAESDPWFIYELPRGRIRADLLVTDDRIVLKSRRPVPPDPPP